MGLIYHHGLIFDPLLEKILDFD